MSQLQIRPYRPEDYEAVFELHRIALEAVGVYAKSGSWDRDLHDIENTYFNNGGTFLVGLIDNRIVAMGALQRSTPLTGEIRRMRVSPEFQRRGFGQAILTALEKEARKRGYANLCLNTTVIQVAAQQLYLKNGYMEVERITKGFPLETIFYEKKLIGEHIVTDEEELVKLRQINNPNNEPTGHFTGRCMKCGSDDLWDDTIAYGCYGCGAVFFTSDMLPQKVCNYCGAIFEYSATHECPMSTMKEE